MIKDDFWIGKCWAPCRFVQLMRTRTLLLFLVYSMPKVEISSPKQMPLIPQTKWVYHVYLCVCFLLVFRAKADWIRDHKRKGATSVVFVCLCLFVICFAFLLEFACAFVCFFYFCVVVNITDIQDTKLVTNHDLVCMAHGWAASMYVWLQ